MGRFRGSVEQARKDLRDMGMTPAEARQKAPHLADLRDQNRDRDERPYSWLGGKSGDHGQWDDD